MWWSGRPVTACSRRAMLVLPEPLIPMTAILCISGLYLVRGSSAPVAGVDAQRTSGPVPIVFPALAYARTHTGGVSSVSQDSSNSICLMIHSGDKATRPHSETRLAYSPINQRCRKLTKLAMALKSVGGMSRAVR